MHLGPFSVRHLSYWGGAHQADRLSRIDPPNLSDLRECFGAVSPVRL